ncbi:hypothetical protein OAG1_10440 [Agarivorans sp. OAG1]|nr:hypothetical protein OAG1_10440 [Agarivorans sp. OAG1]
MIANATFGQLLFMGRLWDANLKSIARRVTRRACNTVKGNMNQLAKFQLR